MLPETASIDYNNK